MPEQSSYDYAVLRVVPRVEREEFVNTGVIVFCPERQFLDARIQIDESRLKALWPEVDIPLLRQHLEAFPKICSGAPDGGPIARLNQRERFHWLVSPRSTIIQVSAVHTGLSDNPERTLETLFHQMIRMP